MPLQPDRNLYSVAPVGGNIIIGRHIALKGGISREGAINLIAWLCIGTNAKPEDIAAEIRRASEPIPASPSPAMTAAAANAAKPPAAVVTLPVAQRPAIPESPAPVAPRTTLTSVPDSPPVPTAVVDQARPFLGDVDAEEAAALQEGLARTAAQLAAGGGTDPVNGDELADAWGKRGGR